MITETYCPNPIDALRNARWQPRSDSPKALNLIANRIFERTQSFKYGSHPSDINSEYRFVPNSIAVQFFKDYYSFRGAGQLNEEEMRRLIASSINAVSNDFSNSSDSGYLFQSCLNSLMHEINMAEEKSIPLLNIIVGPTGSGKTAFSKGLISSTLEMMWLNGIIPSRIEYKRFFQSSDQINTESLSYRIKECQLRDSLIWYYFSSTKSYCFRDIISTHFPDDIISPAVLLSLDKLRDESTGRKIAPNDLSLLEAQQIWRNNFGYDCLESDIEILLSAFCSQYQFRHLVSLDGFDAIETYDFYNSDQGNNNNAVTLVAEFLKGTRQKSAGFLSGPTSRRSHFIIYIRDTTFFRLQIEFFKEPSKGSLIPPKWIVPPSYFSMIEKVCRLVSNDVKSEPTHSDINYFCGSIIHVMKRVINEDPNYNFKKSQLSSIFSWNARFKKKHAGRMLLWSLDNLYRNGSIHNYSTEYVKGYESDALSLILQNTNLKEIQDYQFLESLYLDDTRQLRPRIRCSPANISQKIFKDRDIESALSAVDDYGEMSGFFDSAFNYILQKASIKHIDVNGEKLSRILIFIRILQYCKNDKFINFHDVYEFINKIGYDASDIEVQFIILTLIRNEYIVCRISDKKISLKESQFKTTFSGSFLIDRLIFSVTYFSESMISAQHITGGKASNFHERNFDSRVLWVLDSIYNCSVGREVVKCNEKIERAFAEKNGIDITHFLLSEKLLKKQLDEEKKILYNLENRYQKNINDMKYKKRTFEEKYCEE